MNRRTRTFLVVGIAGALALLASVGVYRAVLRASAPTAASGRHPVTVAATALPLGTMLKAGDLRVVQWPDDVPVAGSVATIESIIGRGVVAPFVEGEPIVAGKLAPAEAGAGLPAAIPPGMRAMAVKVNDVIGVAGFTVPGTHVDVVATVNSGKEEVSRVVLSDVQVLTAGTNQDQSKANDPIRTTVVTLLVTPEDSERLALAMNEGRISLSLRNPLDLAQSQTSGARMSNLVTTMAAPSPVVRTTASRPRVVAPPPPPPPPPPKPYTVEVIRGAKRTEEIIK
jgi:pilus assembly protein CpaB